MPEEPTLASQQLIVRIRARLLRQAQRLTSGDLHTAEDLVQATLLNTHKLTNRDWGMPGAWYSRALYNHAIHHWSRASSCCEEGIVEEHMLDQSECPLDILSCRESRAALRNSLERLPLRYRRILVLRFLKGQSLSQVAEALGLAYNTVRTQQSRGLARLKEMIYMPA